MGWSLGDIDTDQVVRYADLALWWPLNESDSSHFKADWSGRNWSGIPVNAVVDADVPSVLSGLEYSTVFDGSGDRVSQTVNAAAAAGDRTVSLWFKAGAQTNATASSVRILLTQTSGDSIVRYVCMYRSGISLHGQLNCAADGADLNTPLAYNDDAWHNLVFSWESAGASVLYIDGTSVATGTAGSSASDSIVHVGGTASGTANGVSRHFAGKICDVRIYSATLDADEAAAIAAGDLVAASSGSGISNRGLLTGGRR